MTTTKRARCKPTDRPTSDALTTVVRDKLLALGDFAHLHVRRDREHVVVEQPGPPAEPHDPAPVLRLTPIGRFPLRPPPAPPRAPRRKPPARRSVRDLT